jgi:hypothetical protein
MLSLGCRTCWAPWAGRTAALANLFMAAAIPDSPCRSIINATIPAVTSRQVRGAARIYRVARTPSFSLARPPDEVTRVFGCMSSPGEGSADPDFVQSASVSADQILVGCCWGLGVALSAGIRDLGGVGAGSVGGLCGDPHEHRGQLAPNRAQKDRSDGRNG